MVRTGALSAIENINKNTVINAPQVGTVTDALFSNLQDAKAGLPGELSDPYEHQTDVKIPVVPSKPQVGPSVLDAQEMNTNLSVSLGGESGLVNDRTMLPDYLDNSRATPVFDVRDAIIDNLAESSAVNTAKEHSYTIPRAPFEQSLPSRDVPGSASAIRELLGMEIDEGIDTVSGNQRREELIPNPTFVKSSPLDVFGDSGSIRDMLGMEIDDGIDTISGNQRREEVIPDPMYVAPPSKGYTGFKIAYDESDISIPVMDTPKKEGFFGYRSSNPLFDEERLVDDMIVTPGPAKDAAMGSLDMSVPRAQRVNAPEEDFDFTYRVKNAVGNPYDNWIDQSAPSVVISREEKQAFARVHDLTSPGEKITGERDRRFGG